MSAPSSSETRKQAIQDGLSAVEATCRSLVEERAKQAPISRRVGYLRAAAGTASPRAAVKAFCLECLGWDRNEVSRCTGLACPLWQYRPFREASG